MSYKDLSNVFEKYNHIQHINGVLYWDESSMMPKGGGSIRSKAIATLNTLGHNMLLDLTLIDKCSAAKSESLEAWEEKNLALMERQLKINQGFTPDFIERKSLLASKCEQLWPDFKKNNDWNGFKPYLQKLVDISIEESKILSDLLELNPYDALLDKYEPGLLMEHIDPVFDALKKELPQLVQEITKKQKSKPQPFCKVPQEKQRSLSLFLMKKLGFDFERGRLDTSPHPFCGGDPRDVRLTTKYHEEDFSSSIMGVLHETGHAMYEQGLPQKWLDQPVGKAIGMAAHESQSLFIEMQICRSEEFIQFLQPHLEEHFGKDTSLSLENLRQNYRNVEPGFIRIDADEVTYPLHIVLRYELERALFDGSLKVDDVAEAWNSKMETYLGINPKDQHSKGCLQDVHWPAALFGYFPSYTLGALIAAQLKETMQKALPNMKQDLLSGDFSNIFKWLRSNFHEHGSFYTTPELIQKITGQSVSEKAYLDNIRIRYLG